MISKLRTAGLAVILSLSLAGCGYQGWVRYPCQLYENWEKPECMKPQCKVTGTCTEDLIDDGIKK
jgi:predicted small lipoprotein YifL